MPIQYFSPLVLFEKVLFKLILSSVGFFCFRIDFCSLKFLLHNSRLINISADTVDLFICLQEKVNIHKNVIGSFAVWLNLTFSSDVIEN